MKLKDIVNKEIAAGFGNTSARLTVIGRDGKGVTFFGSDKRIEQAPLEKIKTYITPGYVCCKEGRLSDHFIFLKLGQYRLLSASYVGEDDLHIVYLPDEQEIEIGSSEFIKKCRSRGVF